MPIIGLSRPRVRPSSRSAISARSLARYSKRQSSPVSSDDDTSGDESGVESDDENEPDSDDETSTRRPTPTPPGSGPAPPVSPPAPPVPNLSTDRQTSTRSTVTVVTIMTSTPSIPDTTTLLDPNTIQTGTSALTSNGGANTAVAEPVATTASDNDTIEPQGNLGTSSSSSSLSPGALGGIVIAALLVVGLAAFFLIRHNFIQKRVRRRSLWKIRPFTGAFAASSSPRTTGIPGSSRFSGPAMLEAGHGAGAGALASSFGQSRQPSYLPGRSTLAPSRQLSIITSQSSRSASNSVYSDPYGGVVPAAASVASGGSTMRMVKHFYIPERPDEMEVQLGSKLRVLAEYDDGWALCEDPGTRQQGMVPLACFGGSHARAGSLAATSVAETSEAGDEGLKPPPSVFVDKSKLSKRASSLNSPFTPTRE